MAQDTLDPEDLLTLGVQALQRGAYEEAESLFQSIRDLLPQNAEAHYNLANVQRILGKEKSAAENYLQTLRLKPNHTDALTNLGGLYRDRKLLTEAVALFENALSFKENDALIHNNLGSILRDLGQIDRALYHFKKATALNPDDHRAWSNYLFTLNYDAMLTPRDLFRAHREWGERFPQKIETFVPPFSGEKIKIGYVSPDFRTHSVAYFFEPLLKAHDQDHFEIHLYSDVARSDATTERLKKKAFRWTSIFQRPDEEVFSKIRSDGIQILVDLAGHTAGNRLTLFAKKPAPLQITYLGYPNTTGLSTIDYRLTDADADPLKDASENQAESENLIRLSSPFLTYRPSQNTEMVPSQNLQAGIVFASFNAMPKMNEVILSLWADILKQTPLSRLLLKNAALADAQTNEKLRSFFEKKGVDRERLLLQPWKSENEDHLNLYREADIALDTFPYHGTTTTCEALSMGVPVVSLKGDRHASRVGVSLLKSVGLEAASSPEEYVRSAATLAQKPQRLAALRKSLPERMKTSPLCDAAGFARRLEDLYQNLWKDLLKRCAR